jgi:kynurenine formamidase
MSNVLAQLVEELNAGTLKVVDLTQPLGPDTPVIGLPPIFASSPGFSMDVISRYDDGGPAWYWNTIRLGEHTGTHFDAPVHWITGRDLPDNTTESLPPQSLIAPACVIDCTAEAARDADFLLTAEHVRAWEGRHGKIPAGAWVLMCTDWSKRTDPVAYQNFDETGQHTPGPDANAVRLLVERDVLGFGTETIGTDAGQAAHFRPPYPCHTFMHGAGRYGLQCLANLDLLPPTGSIVIAAPLKLLRGSGSPVRALALTAGI